MISGFHTDFTRLASDVIQEKCEQEFQAQLRLTEGELFIFSRESFCGVPLDKPGAIPQAILQYFAESGCPISGLLLGKSLYPYDDFGWPIKSTDLSFRYTFNSIESLINLKHDIRALFIIQDFEKTENFKTACNLAINFIDEMANANAICPEIYHYVIRHAQITLSIH